MCKDCVKSPAPDRGTVCHEGGCYFINLKGCKACGKMDGKQKLHACDVDLSQLARQNESMASTCILMDTSIITVPRASEIVTENDDGEEIIKFNRKCIRGS